MTLLSIIQNVCDAVGVDSPSTAIGNTDGNITRLVRLSNYSGKALAKRFPWQELAKEFSLTTLATESQGALETIMPGFNYDIYQTMWNRSTIFPIIGPLSPSDWQALKALNINGPYPQFRYRGGELLLIPAPAAGLTISGEYVSRYWCEDAVGTLQDEWAGDTDTGVLNEGLLELDLIWRWKRSQGLDYAEEKQDSEIQINQMMARNGSARTLSLESRTLSDEQYPNGIGVPPGNWNL